MTTTLRRAKRKPVVSIDADTWAESGGTSGLYAKAWKDGRLEIVSIDDEPRPIDRGLVHGLATQTMEAE